LNFGPVIWSQSPQIIEKSPKILSNGSQNPSAAAKSPSESKIQQKNLKLSKTIIASRIKNCLEHTSQVLTLDLANLLQTWQLLLSLQSRIESELSFSRRV
jgi:hypothetical protein